MRPQLSILARRLGAGAWQQAACGQSTCGFSATAVAAQPPQTAVCDVPAGHEGSDLRSSVCNISLNRRRDISLRTDIKLYDLDDENGKDLKLLLRGKNPSQAIVSVLFGVPDMGKVCTESHVPGYVRQADRLKELGVHHIYAVAIAPSAKVAEWAESCGLAKSKVQPLSDKTGALSRLLGVEMNKPEDAPPHCHRWSALVEHGILVKLKVENDNASVDSSSADSLVKLLEDAKSRKEAAKVKK